jgi:glycosyltransferase involved in cell wall biosynthesis
MTIDFTVAIPTYNGAQRLPILLDKLRSQVNPNQIAWEILIIDNNSTDNTAEVIQNYQANWRESYLLRSAFELEQGAAFARLRAIREAQGEIVGFLDDDNLPTPDWLTAAYTFSQKYPEAGAFGGQIHGDFEVEPPANFKKIQGFLAIREHGTQPIQFSPDRLQLPPAASLIVRKQAWCESVPSRPSLSGKVAGRFIQGDDYEPLLYLHKAGWQIWYNPAMHTYHQIPRQRLERDYLLTLARGCGLATCQLRMINANNFQKPAILLRTLLGNLRRIISHLIKHRGKLKTDLIAAVELSFFWGCFMSCFYFLRKSVQRQLLLKKV